MKFIFFSILLLIPVSVLAQTVEFGSSFYSDSLTSSGVYFSPFVPFIKLMIGIFLGLFISGFIINKLLK